MAAHHQPDARGEVTLTGVAHGGEAVGRLDDLVAFVALGLPGERVRLEVVERKPRYVRGRAAEIAEASPDRATAPCPIFGTCGGCHWQHASYAAQLAFKTTVLREQLARLGGIAAPPLEPAVPSPLEWHYRNTVQMVPGRQALGPRLLCFQRARSSELVPVEHCYVADPLINRAIASPAWAASGEATWSALESVVLRVVPGEALVVVLVSGARLPPGEVRRFVQAARAAHPELRGVVEARARGAEARAAWGDGALDYELAGSRLGVPAAAFFQVNLGAAARLVERALAWLAPEPDDAVLDAYAGVGTFTLPLARRAAAVVAIEAQPAAAAANARNAAADGLANVRVQAESVERALAGHDHRLGRVDLALVDPPRRGCAPEVIRGIARLRPRRIVYVSCEPSTLARDLKLVGGLGYRLRRVGVVDLFPQTYHLESVSLLELG